MEIERHFTAGRINEIVNHPSIYPWIRGKHTAPLDLTRFAANPANVCLVGAHGCIIFARLQPGIYEFHTSVLPEGRGAWAMSCRDDMLHYMFTQTDAFELMTKCPKGNLAALAGARMMGATPVFATRPIWPQDGGMVPCDVHSLLIQHWVGKANLLIDRGKWFHKTLEMEYSRLGKMIEIHVDDETHDRYVGAAIDMIRGGQVGKAVNFYNRWAAMSDYAPIAVVSADPLVIDIAQARIRVKNNDFEVV